MPADRAQFRTREHAHLVTEPGSSLTVTGALDRTPLLVVGGRQRGDRSLLDSSASWYGYALGVILGVHGAAAQPLKEYDSRPDARGPEDPVLFKCATLQGDELLCCTQTEVLVYDAHDLSERAYLSLPIFNDVHHVVRTPRGTLLVAVSGLELVVEVTDSGEVVREWNVLGEDTWATHDRGIDYRHGVDTKPHRAHPNHLFHIGDEPFVTRFEMRDAVSLDDPARQITIGGERIHDGHVHDGSVWFTSVDGYVVVVDAETLEVTGRHRLGRPPSLGDRDVVLGWCRGIHIEDDHCWVGFSRIRPTRIRETVSWIRTGGAGQAPTRIARYRLSDWTCEAEIDLEPYGVNAVFSILPGGATIGPDGRG